MRKLPAMWICLLILFLLVGCKPQIVENVTNSTPEPASPAGTATPADSESKAVPSEPGESLEPAQLHLPIIILTPAQQDATPEALMTPATTDQRDQVARAIQDLASRLNITPEEIALVDVAEVVWRDGSLGCPQPGIMYTQALVDGMRIRLSAGEVIYHYHSSIRGQPFLCESPAPEGYLPGPDITK
jgi:hypothetical protein